VFGFRNASLTREATHIEITKVPASETIYSNITLSATVRVVNGRNPAVLHSARTISARPLGSTRLPGDTSSTTPMPASPTSAEMFYAGVDQKYGIASIGFQLSTPCMEFVMVFEGSGLRGDTSRGLVALPEKYSSIPPPNARLRIVVLQPAVGEHVIMGHPYDVVAMGQVLDCTGKVLRDLNFSALSMTLKPAFDPVLFSYNSMTVSYGIVNASFTFPALLIDTAGQVKLNFTLQHPLIADIATFTMELEVKIGLWWRTEATLDTLADLEGSTLTMIDGRVVIFGGIGAQGAVSRLAEYDSRLDHVTILYPVSSFIPPARFGHAACGQEHALWVYGGYNSLNVSQSIGGLYRYHQAARVWEDWSRPT
jgi:hypothetical protein